MDNLFDIAQSADRHYGRLFDKSIHNSDGITRKDILELAEEYLDDTEIITDTILDTSFIDADQFWETFRAALNAHVLDDNLSLLAFTKSMMLEVMVALEKRAEWGLTK